jgi:hypothetical protein
MREGREMRSFGPALIALVGFFSPANAQTQCPELLRLRSEAAAASMKTTGLAGRDRCETYIRFSIAWNDLAKYAGDNREACDISISTMNDIERRHREAVQARDNVCTGRRPRPFPAEIILR